MNNNYLVEKRELLYGGTVLLFALLSINGLFYGGLNLIFALSAMALVMALCGYLHKSKQRFTAYGVSLTVLALLILAGFIRSDDGFVKFVLLIFVLLAVSTATTVAACRNYNDGRSITALGWAVKLSIGFGFGGIARSMGGLAAALRNGKGKNMLAVLAGLAIATPVLLIMVPLLIKADAAFDGLMGLLPEFRVTELMTTVVVGGFTALTLFSFGVALVRNEEQYQYRKKAFKGLSKITVSTVLVAVSFIYLMYMLSQLAYLFGGLSGILPADFTLAEYARRGFFEMALLCFINLSVMVGAVAIVQKDRGIPVLCRWLCGFIGLVTLLFVISAAAKMGLYIEGYGLTRLRVLVLVITFFLGLCAVTVTAWLFVPRVPYMKVIMISALIIGAVVLWVDVDSVVASYNVNAYLEGRLKHIDLNYLKTLSDGAVPHIHRLTGAGDQQVAAAARDWLAARKPSYEDIRGWNLASWLAERS